MALFRPFRALGYITEDTVFAVQRRGHETFVTLSVGQSWQVFDCAKLTTALVGPQLPSPICALASKGDLTYAAIEGGIVVCKRVRKVAFLRSKPQGPVLQMLCLDKLLLVLHGGEQPVLQVWSQDSWDEGPQTVVELGARFPATCMAHPDTYLNKVIIGASDGRMQLWNFSSCTMLYEFAGWGSGVRCISPSPALDVVGIGLVDGRAVIHNVRTDEEITSFENASGLGTSQRRTTAGGKLKGVLPSTHGRAVSCIAFRDSSVGPPIMAAAGSSGAITYWNLKDRRLHAVTRDAHSGRICSLYFFPGEPRLMSSGADNSVKQWVFDAAEGPPRLLRFRAGHSAPPTIIRHYGNGKIILSAGSDLAFRLFSSIQDQQSQELSQRNVERRAKKQHVRPEELKLPRVVALDACQVRERDWANIVTAHEGSPSAYTWLLKDAVIGEHVLTPPTDSRTGGDRGAPVTAVTISRCGNFAIVGTAAGAVHRFNLQSGIHRGEYTRGDGAPAHDGSVTGAASDSRNHSLLTCGYDGWLRRWGFRSRRPDGEVRLESQPSHMAYHAGSGLLAVAGSSLEIRMYDAEVLNLVRRFRGHTDRITDLAISGDARWVLSSSMDGTLRVWDIAVASILQVLDMGAPVASFSLSPEMEMLATSHPEQQGIFLWSNSQIFRGAGSAAVADRDETPLHARVEKATVGRRDDGEEEGASDEEDEEDGPRQEGGDGGGTLFAELPELRDADGRIVSGVSHPELVTVSLLPKSQWESLAVLEIIKERNKPVEPPKKPEAAPFFLPTVSSASMGRQPVFEVPEQPADGASADSKGRGSGTSPAEFGKVLHTAVENGDFDAFSSLIKSMTPSAIDMEVRARELLEGASDEEVMEIDGLLQYVESQLIARKDFEFVQAFFRMLLKIHGDAMISHQSLSERANRVRGLLNRVWSGIDSKCQNIRCMLSFFCGQL